MKKSFLILLSYVMIGGIAKAQSQSEVKMENKKTSVDSLWINESIHDFGKIPQGKPVTVEFDMKNLGKDSLKLESVRAGCGCTTPVWTPGSYAPGGSFKITVGYNAASEGSFTKPVTITYNGGQQKVINITGTVYKIPDASAPKNNALEKLQN